MDFALDILHTPGSVYQNDRKYAKRIKYTIFGVHFNQYAMLFKITLQQYKSML